MGFYIYFEYFSKIEKPKFRGFYRVISYQNSILEEIRLNSKISYDELADKFSKNRTTIMRNIQKLKALGFIERVGSDKSGYWRVKR